MQLYFKCSDKDFKNIDLFLAEQEYSEKPAFDSILLETSTNKYHYKISQVNNNYYIVTD